VAVPPLPPPELAVACKEIVLRLVPSCMGIDKVFRVPLSDVKVTPDPNISVLTGPTIPVIVPLAESAVPLKDAVT
jgi:hypothetical protein